MEQVPAVRLQRALILGDQALQLGFEGRPVGLRGHQLVDRDQERRIGDDARAAVGHPGQLGQFLHAVPGPRLGQALVQVFALPGPELGVELRPQLGDVRARVPDVQVGHAGELTHGLPVAGGGDHHDLAALLGRKLVVATGDFQAGRQPLDIPFPRAGQGLVEVVDVEHQATFGRAEQAEVGQVRVAAGLHGQPGHRRGGQVAGHRQGRAAVVGKRGDHHPPPPDRDQFG